MRQFIIILLLLFIQFKIPVFAEDKVTIAVLDLTPNNIPKIVSNAISDIIRSEFVNIGNFTVVERSQMNAILKEQGLQMTGCTDAACAVQFGKILSARRIVIGEVNKVGKNIVITARYVDVGSGRSLFSANGKSPSLDDIDTTAKNIAKDLAKKIIAGDKEILTPITKLGYYGRGSIPGWGQLYAERDLKGYIFISVFSLSALFTAYTLYDFNVKKSAYENEDPPQSKIDKKFDEYDKAADMTLYSAVTIGTVYLLNWIDIIFLSKPEFEQEESTLNYKKNETYYSFNIYNCKNLYPENGLSVQAKFKF